MNTNAHSNAALLTSDSHTASESPPKSGTERAHNAIERTAEAAHRAIDKTGPAVNRWIEALRRHTAQSPLTALGITLFVGFLLGRIL